MIPFLLALRWGIFQEGRFLGKVLDEWGDDTQEFIHSKLPHLVVVLVIAFILIRLRSSLHGWSTWLRRMLRAAYVWPR